MKIDFIDISAFSVESRCKFECFSHENVEQQQIIDNKLTLWIGSFCAGHPSLNFQNLDQRKS